MDASHSPLEGAAVALVGPVRLAAASGPEGTFAFEALPEGEYRVEVALPGHALARRTTRIAVGGTANVEVVLSPLVYDRVVVTAERTRESDLMKLPASVSVLSRDELERVRATTVEDLAGRAPSFTFSQNTGFAQLTVRGIGTNAVFAGSDPSTPVYADGVYLARPVLALADLIDVERVEVVRGPRGPLYGRNALGGALNVVTRDPSNELAAEARFEAGELGARRALARLAGPLVDGRLLGSATFVRGVRRGFVRDLDHPDYPLGGEDVTAGRAKLQLLLGAESELLLAGDVSHKDPVPLTYAKVLGVKPGFTVDNPSGPREVRASALAESRSLQYGASARYSQGLGRGVKLTNLLAWRSLDYDVRIDGDITELDLTISDVHEIHHQWSEELTVTGGRPGFAWTSGLFLFSEEDHQPTEVRFPTAGVVNVLDPRVQARSAAAFGQATLGLGRRVSTTLGLRYTHDRKTIDNAGGLFPASGIEGALAGTDYAYTDSISGGAWTPRLVLDLALGPETIAYASASRGFKSGGFNLSSPVPGRGFAPEWAWSYEAGFKKTFADGRARLSLAAFHTDYSDLQVQITIRPGVVDISNAAEAEIRGVELEGALRLAPRLQLGGHLAWLDARYDEYVAVGVGGVTGDVAGRRLSNAPEWSGRAWAEWSAPAFRGTTLSLRVDSRFQSTVSFTPFNDAVQRQSPYGLLDASLELGTRRVTLGVYGRNLTDEDYITGTFSSPPPAIGGRPGEPRLVGVQLTLRHSRN